MAAATRHLPAVEHLRVGDVIMSSRRVVAAVIPEEGGTVAVAFAAAGPLPATLGRFFAGQRLGVLRRKVAA